MNAGELRTLARDHKLERLLQQAASGATEQLATKLRDLGADVDGTSLRALAEAALAAHEDAASVVAKSTATLRKAGDARGAIPSATGGQTPSLVALRAKPIEAKDVSKTTLVESPD